MYSQTANKTKGKKTKRLATEPRAVAAKSFLCMSGMDDF
jgi:hypothetical protein